MSLEVYVGVIDNTCPDVSKRGGYAFHIKRPSDKRSDRDFCYRIPDLKTLKNKLSQLRMEEGDISVRNRIPENLQQGWVIDHRTKKLSLAEMALIKANLFYQKYISREKLSA